MYISVVEEQLVLIAIEHCEFHGFSWEYDNVQINFVQGCI